jgi:hypothetical protein
MVCDIDDSEKFGEGTDDNVVRCHRSFVTLMILRNLVKVRATTLLGAIDRV